MNLRASVFIAASLDGFIAGENGELDWLDAANALVPEGEDCGFQAFFETVDVLIMGRNTFEKVLQFDTWGYGKTRVIVLSRNAIEIPEKLAQTVTHSSETPKELWNRLSEEGAGRLYIDGGITIQRFLAEGLIDDITITLIPVILGKGIPLFGETKKNIHLTPITVKKYDFGFVQLTYQVESISKF